MQLTSRRDDSKLTIFLHKLKKPSKIRDDPKRRYQCISVCRFKSHLRDEDGRSSAHFRTSHGAGSWCVSETGFRERRRHPSNSCTTVPHAGIRQNHQPTLQCRARKRLMFLERVEVRASLRGHGTSGCETRSHPCRHCERSAQQCHVCPVLNHLENGGTATVPFLVLDLIAYQGCSASSRHRRLTSSKDMALVDHVKPEPPSFI